MVRSRKIAPSYVPWYIGTMNREEENHPVERVQTGVRMEKRLLKVLKAFAEYHDLTLGDLLEGIVLHAFDGKLLLAKVLSTSIKELKKFYGLRLDSKSSHRLKENAVKQRHPGQAPFLACPAMVEMRVIP